MWEGEEEEDSVYVSLVAYKGKGILQSLVQNAESLECHGYGTVVPLTAQLLRDFGLPFGSKQD